MTELFLELGAHTDASATIFKSGGWMEGSNQELLLWVPPRARSRVFATRDRLVIDRAEKTVFDFNDFAHGIGRSAGRNAVLEETPDVITY